MQTLCSFVGAADTECRDYDEVHYEKPDDYALSRINIEELEAKTKLQAQVANGSKELSPQGTKHFVLLSPDFVKEGPWHSYIYVLGNQAKPVRLKMTFRDHGNGGVQAKWLNEKLLFVQVWWGRIVSTDLILDVESSKWIYSQNANYGNLIMSCPEKMKGKQ